MLKVLANSKSSEIIFFPSAIVMSQSVKVFYWSEMACLISTRIYWFLNLYQWTYLSSLFYFFVLLIHIDFFVFICKLIFSRRISSIFIFQSGSNLYCFLKIFIHKRCLVTSYKFLFQRNMFINCFQEIFSYAFLIYI